ncbi:MAG: hypothetical protein KKF44_11680, partial [Nanoarchaeota archaeon]|nr:hypothetical protein [Nanoarchaeota archaeon]
MILKINSKKSQTEIFGVVLIVVILTMFGLYMLISDQARNRKSISASLADSESAQSFVDALINMKTDQN